MLRRTAFVTFTSLALATANFAANAGISFTNLGTGAPPAAVGGYTMLPFDQAAQAAIPDSYDNLVTSIPGNPLGGNLGISPANKATTPATWGTWSHGYTGAIYFTRGTQATLTLPANTHAFYFYAEPDSGTFTLNAISDSGTSSGPIAVAGNSGATGYAFYATAGEKITTITVTAQTGFSDFALGEFGIAGEVESATTCASEGYKNTQLTWCKNICENGLTGKVLDSWIHRWIERYRQLPYCAVEPPQV